uniref:Uncharacterized protein n=1 Tax=Arundo donax TaxID=35708 RepID=A0A0A8ZUY5_ARUDO
MGIAVRSMKHAFCVSLVLFVI